VPDGLPGLRRIQAESRSFVKEQGKRNVRSLEFLKSGLVECIGLNPTPTCSSR